MAQTQRRPATRQRQTAQHFRGTAEAGAPRIVGVGGVHRADPGLPQVLETQRYDTDDNRLATAGIVLTVHRGDGPAHWQLVLPDGAGRELLRIPVPSDAPDPPPLPGEIDELVRGASRNRAVRPVGRIRVLRTTTGLHDEEDRLLAEVRYDEVSVATLGATTDVLAWTEAEIRPAHAGAELMAELGGRLVEDGMHPAPPGAEAALDGLLRPAPPSWQRARTGRKGSAGAVLLSYLAAQVERIAVEDLRVRRDEPDAVHQLRVASRRLRSALQAYRPLLDRERTDPLVDELRALGQVLAPARDAEVLRGRISTGLSALSPELLLGPAQAQVTRHFARREAEARAAVLAELDGQRYATLRAALDALLEDPPLNKRARGKAQQVLPAVAARTARRLERAMDVVTGPQVDAAERDRAVHAARKAGKRMRYATEVAKPAVGKPAKRFTRSLKKFQSALGEHQDTVVARPVLRELGALAHAAGDNGFSFGVLHGEDTSRATEIERRLPDLWAAAWKGSNRRWLG